MQCKHCNEPKEELVGKRRTCDACRREAQQAYKRTPKGKAVQKTYAQSTKGKEAQKTYKQSPKGQAVQRSSNKVYRQSRMR